MALAEHQWFPLSDDWMIALLKTDTSVEEKNIVMPAKFNLLN